MNRTPESELYILQTPRRAIALRFTDSGGAVWMDVEVEPLGNLGDEDELAEWFYASMAAFRDSRPGKGLRHERPSSPGAGEIWRLLEAANVGRRSRPRRR